MVQRADVLEVLGSRRRFPWTVGVACVAIALTGLALLVAALLFPARGKASASPSPRPLVQAAVASSPEPATAVGAQQPGVVDASPRVPPQLLSETMPVLFARLYANPTVLEVGTPARVWVSAKNRGAEPSSSQAQVEVRDSAGQFVSSHQARFTLDPGQAESRFVEWVPAAAGPYSLSVRDMPWLALGVEVHPRGASPGRNQKRPIALNLPPRAAPSGGLAPTRLSTLAEVFEVDRPVEMEVAAENRGSAPESWSIILRVARFMQDPRFSGQDNVVLGKVEGYAAPGQSVRQHFLWTPRFPGRYQAWLEEEPALRVGMEVRE